MAQTTRQLAAIMPARMTRSDGLAHRNPERDEGGFTEYPIWKS